MYQIAVPIYVGVVVMYMLIVVTIMNMRISRPRPKRVKPATKPPRPTVTLLQGIDLHIDSDVYNICESANKTSSTTRSVLYILVIVTLLSLVGCYNTRGIKDSWYGSWPLYRLSHMDRQIKQHEDSLDRMKAGYIGLNDTTLPANRMVLHTLVCFFPHDSATARTPLSQNALDTTRLKRALSNLQLKRDYIQRNWVENYQTLRMPILGIAIDIDDLAIVTGVALIFLMMACRFNLKREANNLSIALATISSRYTAESDKEHFKDLSPDQIEEANRLRRSYHYSQLVMNEVFTLLDSEHITTDRVSLSQRVASLMFYIPGIAYVCIMFNDVFSFRLAEQMSWGNAMFSIGFGVFAFVLILELCTICTRLKTSIGKQYSTFRNENYIHQKENFSYHGPIGKVIKFVFPKWRL